MAEAVGSYMFELAAAEVISWSTAAAVSTFVSTYGAYVVLAASMAYSASEARRMQAEAKDAAANATRDRTVTVTGAVVPRDLVLGRARTGGANFYHAVTGTDSNTLYVTIALAGHQIDAVEQIYVNDGPVTLDADGFVTTAPYSLPTTAFGTETADASGAAVLNSKYAGLVKASKVVRYDGGRNSDRAVSEEQAVTVTGTGTTLDPYIAHTTPGATVSYNYTDTTTGSLRFAVHLGGDDQVVDPWLHAEFAEWLSTYVVKGVAYLVARMVYDTNAFPSSVPSISALVRGALVDDPRATYSASYLLGYASGGPVDTANNASTENHGAIYAATNSYFNAPAFYFNGSSYIKSTIPGGLGDATFCLEFYICLLSASGMVFNCRTNGTDGDGFDISANGRCTQDFQVLFNDNTFNEYIGQLIHVAISRLENNNLNLWIQGNLIQASSFANDLIGQSFYIGGSVQGNIGYCTGYIPVSGLRITRGNPVYRTAFTPPALPLVIQAGSTHAWSENPALLMRHVYQHPSLGAATISAEEDERFIAAANACDTPTVYTVGGVAQPARALFTAGGAWRFDGGAPSNILNDLAQAMGGAWAFAGGELYVRAGVYTAPVMTLTDADLAVVQRTGTTENQSPIEVSVHRPNADMLNTIIPIIYDAANEYSESDIVEVSSAELVARDGGYETQTVKMPAISYAPQAQHVAGIIIRDGRDSLTVKAPFKLRAYPLEMFDCITLQLSELGINGTFLVVGRSFVQGVVNLTFKETAAQITTLGANFVAGGYANNTHLPKPWEVATIGLLSISSGTQWLKTAGDGTIQSYMHVTWPAVTDVSVLQGGTVELQYRLGTAAEWTTLIVPGNSADALIGPVTDGNHYLLQARLCSAIYQGRFGQLAGHTVVGKTEPPPAFDSFVIAAQPDGTRQYNFGYSTTATPPDWMGAEIRYTTGNVATPDWASMTPLQDGTSYYTNSPVELNAPQAGTYTFACKSLDTTGNESPALVRTITLPDRRLANVFDWYDEGEEGWPGTRTDCFVSGAALEANDTTTWDTAPATWAAWTRWNLNPASPIGYTSPVRDLGIVIAASFDIALAVQGSYTQQLRTSTDGSTWGAWGSVDDSFTARYIQWRITVAATTAQPVPTVLAARYQIAAPMRQEYLNDIDISTLPAPYRLGVGDVRVPIIGSYIIIKRTTVVVQDGRAGQWAYVRLDQDLSPGPRWQFRLDGVLTDPALVDFYIEAF